MPLLLTTAQALSTPDMEKGLIETIIYRDDLFQFLPFMSVNGKAHVYYQENNLPSVDWLTPNAIWNESAGDVSEKIATLRIMGGDVDIDKFLDQTMSDHFDQTAVQVQLKLKAANLQFRQMLAVGSSSNPNGFDGLPNLCDPSQVINAGPNGASVSLSMLDQLKDAVILGADAFVMRAGTWRAIKQLMRATGGTSADMIQLPNFGVAVPAFDGIPVLRNDFLSATETVGTNSNTCSIYAVRMNELDGLCGLNAAGAPAGLVVENIGTVQNKDANRIRVKWYVSLMLKSIRSLARVNGVTSV